MGKKAKEMVDKILNKEIEKEYISYVHRMRHLKAFEIMPFNKFKENILNSYNSP